jgi:uncharacterized membrane protein YkvA (DUF1232 family)
MPLRSLDLRQWARRLKQETLALYLAARHPATPWYAKVWAGAIVAYALSPIDLIPDFIPVLGYLDDVIILPAMIWVALRLVPIAVMTECRAQAADVFADGRPVNRAAAAVIVAIWVFVAVLVTVWFVRFVAR